MLNADVWVNGFPRLNPCNISRGRMTPTTTLYINGFNKTFSVQIVDAVESVIGPVVDREATLHYMSNDSYITCIIFNKSKEHMDKILTDKVIKTIREKIDLYLLDVPEKGTEEYYFYCRI